MRSPIQWNDPRVVERLHDDDDVSGPLNDLIIAIEGIGADAADSRHPGGNAARVAVQILGASGCAIICRERSAPLLRCWRQRWNPSIGWIDNQRRPMVELTLNHVSSAAVGAVRAPVLFGIRQGGEEEIVTHRKIGVAVCEESIRVPFQVCNFCVSERRSALESLRPFERRRAVVQPDTLQVRLAVVGARRLPRRGF